MIPNHRRFVEAVVEGKKVSVRFFSLADSGVLDRICAPLDYGPGPGMPDGLNRYWVWDYQGSAGAETLALAPQQIVELQVLGAAFDPAGLAPPPWPWAIERSWVLALPARPPLATGPGTTATPSTPSPPLRS
jgi:hypothetical protein